MAGIHSYFDYDEIHDQYQDRPMPRETVVNLLIRPKFSRKGQRTSQKYQSLERSDQHMQRLVETELRKDDRTVQGMG